MNRNLRTAIKFLVIVAAIFTCTVAAYQAGVFLSGHQMANASGNMNFSQWQEKFFKLTSATGGACGLCTLLWFLAARFFLTVDTSQGAGRRTIWAAFAILSLVASLAVPYFYAPILRIKIDGLILGVFAVLFAGVGYWLTTIFTTPLAFKYTPLGAQIIRWKD